MAVSLTKGPFPGLHQHSRRDLDTSGDVAVEEVFDRYLQYYGITVEGHPELKLLLRSLVELSLFCAVHRGQTIKQNDECATSLTALIGQYAENMDTEFAKRSGRQGRGPFDSMRKSLLTLAERALEGNDSFEEDEVKRIIQSAGVEGDALYAGIDCLCDYGILFKKRRPISDDPLATKGVQYHPGNKRVWDYYLARRFLENRHGSSGKHFLPHVGFVEMLALLMVEEDGVLPCDDPLFSNDGYGKGNSWDLTMYALSSAVPTKAGTHRDWVLSRMAEGGETLSEVVDRIVMSVAGVPGHPLGPVLLNEFLRSFSTPAARDAIWSIPVVKWWDYRFAMADIHDQLRDLPRLTTNMTCDQLPLVFVWQLTSVDNLRRSYCAGELVKWGRANPSEFSKLYQQCLDTNDPQTREDLVAIASQVICWHSCDDISAKSIATETLRQVFCRVDCPGNRDAAVRHFGRIVVERCLSNGVLREEEKVLICRPPYAVDASSEPIKVYEPALGSKRGSGFGPIGYDLARYVLVDHLESVFDAMSDEKGAVTETVRKSLPSDNHENCEFEGWVIAGAYQYLLDHGYDPEVYEGPANEEGHRKGGIDRKIASSFFPADHGSRTTIMTIAEKYVWCAMYELCGYLADRVPIERWMVEGHEQALVDEAGLSKDYTLLSFVYRSPLLESLVLGSSRYMLTAESLTDEEIACSLDPKPPSLEDLMEWADSVSADDAIAAIQYKPAASLGVPDEYVVICGYVSKWTIGGKWSRTWIDAGTITRPEYAHLCGSKPNQVTLPWNASHEMGCSVVADVYVTPVEAIASPWSSEEVEPLRVSMESDGHTFCINPLGANYTASISDMGDYASSHPGELLREALGVDCTDGERYYDAAGKVVCRAVSHGTPYRNECDVLFADGMVLKRSMAERGLVPVWMVRVERRENLLAQEKWPESRVGTSGKWLCWYTDDGIVSYAAIVEEDRTLGKENSSITMLLPVDGIVDDGLNPLSLYRSSDGLAAPAESDSWEE